MKEYIVTFFTHSGAIKFERVLSNNNINSELIPVPRKLSSNCTIGVKFSSQYDIFKYINSDVEKLFVSNSNSYSLVYESE